MCLAHEDALERAWRRSPARRSHPGRALAVGNRGAWTCRADGNPGFAIARTRRCTGHPVLLLELDRNGWDRLLIRRGLAALARAEACGSELGPYGLPAAIAARQARATGARATDWTAIVARCARPVAPSPVVELNRAAAVAMAFRPAAGLDIVDALAAEPVLARYHLLPSVRSDLLVRLDRLTEARAEFEHAATLTRNGRERALLPSRAARCSSRTRTGDRPT